jgi:uncharacterized protein YceK
MRQALAALLLVFTLSGCATIQSVASSKETFVACQVFDTATTYVAVSKVGLVEGNPIIAALLKHGWLPVIAFKLAIIWAVYEANFSPAAQTVANVVACVPGIHNAILIGGQ